MTQRFAQLSDPHLTSLRDVRAGDLLNKRLLGYISWRRKRRHEHRMEVLDALREDLPLEQLSQLLITGDLTHIGLPDEFSQARTWLKGLGAADKIALVPGNHDACVTESWDNTFGQWSEYMASDAGAEPLGFPSLRIRDDVAFIGLSSACPTPPLMASGRVGDAELSTLEGLLDSCRERRLFRVVYIHHSPVPGQEKWRKRLVNAPRVAEVLAQHGAELVLHGHGHRVRRATLPGRDGEIPVLAIPSASALGLHGADLAAYNLYDVQRTAAGWQLEVNTRQFDPTESCFGEGSRYQIEVERS